MEQAGFPHLHERYLLGELSGEDRRDFEAHALGCPECAEEVATGSEFIEAARRVLHKRTQEFAGPPVLGAAPTLPRDPWWRRLWPGGARGAWIPRLAVVASVPLAAIVLYQSTVLVPRLQGEIRRRDQPGALSPVTLRPPTRGPKQAVHLDPQDHRLVLAVGPMDVAPGQPLEVGIARGDGTAVLPDFKVAASRLAGEPLQIVLPTAVLGPGEYEVVVRAVREQAPPAPLQVWRFEFSISRGEHVE
jgi:hypothetical protein